MEKNKPQNWKNDMFEIFCFKCHMNQSTKQNIEHASDLQYIQKFTLSQITINYYFIDLHAPQRF